ncbi:type II toxin-antitoxin system HicA family toxin [Reyranella sp.]|uniref:type II toxin-antitoxin system HicA family toxin n=1 Tax=Reyranella sp. TaxID=1929291 RepID=UPI003D0F4D3D
MTRYSPISGRDLVAALGRGGFGIVRVRGSHYVLRHQDGRMTVVPVHGREEIGPGLLTKILRDCQLTRDELQELL